MKKKRGQQEAFDLTTVGGRMRWLMRRAGLSSEAVAEGLADYGVTVTGAAVRKWTLDRGEPLLQHLRALARITGGSLAWLLEGPEGEARAVASALVRFADQLASGVDPVEALSEITGGLTLPGLSGSADQLQAVLDAHAPAPWSELSDEEKRRVLREVEAVGRHRRRRRLARGKNEEEC